MNAAIEASVQPVTKKVSILRRKFGLALLGFGFISWYFTRTAKISGICLVVYGWYLLLTGYGWLSVVLGKVKRCLRPLLEWLPWFGRFVRRFGGVEWESIASGLFLATAILWLVVWSDERIVIIPELFGPLSYARWEVAALAWNAVFGSVSYLALPMVNRFVPPLRIAGGPLLTGVALSFLEPENCIQHLRWVFVISLCYFIADIIISRSGDEECEQCGQTALYADLPSMATLAVLLGFMYKNPHAQEMHVFVSGAIAFQFIASSIVLALIESRAISIFSCPALRKTIPPAPGPQENGQSSVARATAARAGGVS